MSRVTIRNRSFLLPVTVLILGCWTRPAPAQDVYQARDGIVVIEAESADVTSGWTEHAPSVSGIRGKALLSEGGDNICSTSVTNAKGLTPLEYHFRITESGTYTLRLNIHKQVHCVDVANPSQLDACHDGAKCVSHGVQSDGDSCPSDRCWRSDVSNDAFVNIVTASGDPMNWVGGTSDLTKLYGGSGTAYAWSGDKALDHDHQKHAPNWDLPPGDYVLEIRYRSNGFSFDRLILVKDGASDSDAKMAPESPVVADDPTGTGGAMGTGGTFPTGGADPGAGGTDQGTGGAHPGSGGAADGSFPDDEILEGTGSGDDSPKTGSSDEGGCSFGPGRSHPRAYLLATLMLLGATFRRRRAA